MRFECADWWKYCKIKIDIRGKIEFENVNHFEDDIRKKNQFVCYGKIANYEQTNIIVGTVNIIIVIQICFLWHFELWLELNSETLF